MIIFKLNFMIIFLKFLNKIILASSDLLEILD